MHDLREGVTPTGAITTGASRNRVTPTLRPVLDASAARHRSAVGATLDGVIARIVASYETVIGLWNDDPS